MGKHSLRYSMDPSDRQREPASKTLVADFKIQSGAFLDVVITDSQIAPSPANAPANYLGNVPGSGNIPAVTAFRGLDQLAQVNQTCLSVSV